MQKDTSRGSTGQGQNRLLELWTTAQKIFSQELRSGCADRTVYGGAERFLSNWASSISALDSSFPTWPEAKRVLGILAGYSSSDAESREAAARAALELMDQVVERVQALGIRDTGTRGRGDTETRGEGKSTQHPAIGTRPSAAGTRKPAAPSSTTVRRAAAAARLPQPQLALDDPVLAMRGVGKQRAGLLAKLGITRLRDLLLHFPRDYRDYRAVKRVVDLMYGETASVVGSVEDVQVLPGPRNRFRTTVRVRDESGRMTSTWFRYGYAGVKLSPGSNIAMAGTVSGFGGGLSFDSPDWEMADSPPLHTRRLVPVYPLTEGVSDYWLREIMSAVVPQYASRLSELLPSWLLEKQGLLPLPEAVLRIHFPANPGDVDEARHRLAFDELLLMQLAALKRRAEWQSGATAQPLVMDEEALESFLACQPFALTGAQRRVVAEIRQDLGSSLPMTRLLEGEVGSGKTIVAAVALLSAVAAGYQGAIMAPTEILAEQHARTLEATFGMAQQFIEGLLGRPLRTELLTGSSRKADRERIYRDTEAGLVDLVVGTQALIQEGLGFKRLGLAVIDEQHRFGVAQRTALREKGGTPHLLVMTATPIPRTLALVLYGDLDLSVIDELPPGRQKVKTVLLTAPERVHAYEHIRREAGEGRQTFIICPLVEDSPHLEVRAATAEYERLQSEELSGLRLALLHGRMKPSEKDRIMLEFKRGEHDVLVSTSVVEVGIDVPNATVMLVEGAERFGLAQLHQFRGRVGRGSHASSCILLTDSEEESSLERLRTVASVSDGFKLADEDLKLRGPGEYFGVRQSGFPDFRMADLGNVGLVESARAAAAELLRRDPELSKPEHQQLANRVEELRRAESS
jgi:ATP-dependent DNA helicase RecG